MSAKCPSRRKMHRRAQFRRRRCTTSPSSTTVLLPGSVLAGTGVEASARSRLRSRFGSPTRDLDRIAVLAAMRIADRHAAEQRLDRVVDVALLDAEDIPARPGRCDSRSRGRGWPYGIVDIDDVGHRCEELLDLLRDRAAGRGFRAVDFGQQRRQHRRPGRHLDHLAAWCPRGSCSACSRWRRSSAMAWLRALALALRGEVDLQFAQLRRLRAYSSGAPGR